MTSLDTLLGPPAPALTGIDNDAGDSASDFITNDPTLMLSGTSVPNTRVTVTRFGVGVIGTAMADGSGHWALDYSGTELPNGETFFTAAATDANDRTGAQASPPFRVTVDLVAPAAPTIADLADLGSLVLTGHSEPNSIVTVRRTGAGVIGTTVAKDSGQWTFAYPGPSLPPGRYSFRATATDLAGNTGPTSGTMTVDTRIEAPVITAITEDTGSSATDGVTADNTLILRGTATANRLLTIKIVDGAVIGGTKSDETGRWSFDYTRTPLAEGAYLFSASTSNGAGASPSSRAFPVRVDTQSPTAVSVNRLNPMAANSSFNAITFRVTFSEPVIGIDAADFTPVFTAGLSGPISNVVAAGDRLFEVTVGPLTGEGTVRLDVNASGNGIADAAGNTLKVGFNTGQVYSRSLVGSGVWVQGASGETWNANANWLNGIVGGGVGSTADFSSLELVDDLRIRLDAPRTVGNLVFGDTDLASPGNWIIDNNGSAENLITMAVTSGSPTITVNALGVGAVTMIEASLAGNQGLTKIGTGPLVLGGPSSLTGTLVVNGGVLRLGAGSSLNLGNSAVNLGANTQLNIAGGSFATGGAVTAASSVVIDSGSVTLGDFRSNSDFGSTLRLNGGTLALNTVVLLRNSAANPDFASGFIVAGGNATVNTIGLGTGNSTGALSVEGGSLTATGVITIGNQVTGGRGGAMRVLNGAFTSTETANGIVLCRTNGANANNVASAAFNGGVSTVEKFTLGFDQAVTAGSATLTINGGTLYLGGGGIVKNGAPGLVTNLNFGQGLLGAKADWGTNLPITLPNGGNLVFKAADASNVAHQIMLAGSLSGGGGLTKTGGGRLTLAGANTFTGAVAVSGGTLQVDGSLTAGGEVVVNSDGVLSGAGTLNRAVVLNAGGAVSPGGASSGSTLTAASLTWNAGGAMVFELGSAANQLAVTGALTKGGSGAAQFVFRSGTGFAAGTYTLATFGSTDLTVSDLAYSGLPAGFTGTFTMTPNSILFEVSGAPATGDSVGGGSMFSAILREMVWLWRGYYLFEI
ncbi:MAG TPA: Ig-like domain-containing protein [Blastocatellia bacterium]|nr:Ig-like domain-containing protein [Blastocatellia bacterium]